MNEEQSPEAGKIRLVNLNGMYENYFLDYASYVILERAVPAFEDGLKPVQRRIMHTLFEMHDGRYHKVANVIGQTMALHPHGDAAIGDAMVHVGQKDLLLDCQGNWGDVRTGDSAAASRYIEVRLTKFALDVAFNPKTTVWQLSYDGRRREPVVLPMKFPLLLVQGVEGIAVGLSTKIMPHNFIEVIKAAVNCLKGKSFELYPDFLTGGAVDISDYQDGKRGGKILCRATIEKLDKNMLAVTDLPFGVTTGSLIESIIKAADKGKIKIKRVTDNTAEKVEVLIELAAGVSPDVTLDALYAFTDCQVSISPNACVVAHHKPIFTGVSDLLRMSVDLTKELLRQELLIEQAELEEKWHFASLEKIFIEQRIYRDIEESESFDIAKQTILAGLKRFVSTPADAPQASETRLLLRREITEEDIERLTEIRIRRISKYNTFAAEEYIAKLEDELVQVRHHLAHLTEFTIAYYEDLLKKYGKGRERRTVIRQFDQIQATEVVANNAKLYVNRAEGFVGMGLKKDEFVCDCSDLDDILVIRRDGKFTVTRIAEKTFVGKDILHVAVWRKNDERTTYNAVYCDGRDGTSFVKRFQIIGITRDKEYDISKGTPGSRMLYFSANANSEAELITVTLTPGCKARVKVFDYNFAELEIKGRAAQGNTLTKYPVRKVSLKEAGKSTIGAQVYSLDEVSGKLTTDGRGRALGHFDTGDSLLLIYADGHYEISPVDTTRRFPIEQLMHIGKFDESQVITAVYYEGGKGWTLVKRFKIESRQPGQRYRFISDHKLSKLHLVSLAEHQRISYEITVKSKKYPGEAELSSIVDVKGWKALGNKLSESKLSKIGLVEAPAESIEEKLTPGTTIDFDVQGVQGELF